jgi:hypothetical protein
MKSISHARKAINKIDEKIKEIDVTYWDSNISQMLRDDIWSKAINNLEQEFQAKLSNRKRKLELNSMQYSSIYDNYILERKPKAPNATHK